MTDTKAASSDVLAATGESAAVPAGGEGDSNDSLVNAIVALAPVELICHLGAGGVAGFTSAYAFKQIGKAAAFFCGVTFIGLQVRISASQQVLANTVSEHYYVDAVIVINVLPSGGLQGFSNFVVGAPPTNAIDQSDEVRSVPLSKPSCDPPPPPL